MRPALRSFRVSARQNSTAWSNFTFSTGKVSPLKKLGLLPITDWYSAWLISCVPIQNRFVRVIVCWTSVTRTYRPGSTATIRMDGLNTNGLGSIGAAGSCGCVASQPANNKPQIIHTNFLGHNVFIRLRAHRDSLFLPIRPLNFNRDRPTGIAKDDVNHPLGQHTIPRV